MSSRHFLKLAILMVLLSAIFLSASSGTFAQRAGLGGKGGSNSRETPEGARREIEPIYYHPVVRKLKSDFPEIRYDDLERMYEDAKQGGTNKNPGLKFETVIKAFIAAKQLSPQSDEDDLLAACTNIVNSLKEAGNNLSKALQQVFPSVTKEQAKKLERAANARYVQAKREVGLL